MLTSRDLKHRNKGQGKGGGRPEAITPAKASILLAAFENGLNLKQALQHANVAKATYERKRANDPKFRDQIEAAQTKLIILAKAGIANKIRQGDATTLRWYLERKCPEEFGRHVMDHDADALPSNIRVVLPMGSKPHPRITIDPDDPYYEYEDKQAAHTFEP